MRLLLLGAPGSGKGTQADRLATHFGVEHISTGELLRAEVAAGTSLGRRVSGYIAAGDLVPDDLVEEFLRDRLVGASLRGGYVLDGFPRTVHQAQAAYEIARQAGATVHAVVHLDVPAAELLHRLLSRGQGRVDDDEPTIRHRLEVYDRETRPLLDYYANRGVLVTVPATDSVDQVFDAIIDRLRSLPPDRAQEIG